MAFSGAQKAKIRFYLGYPQVHLQANPRLEGALDVIGANVDQSNMVVALLAQLDAQNGEVIDSAGAAGIRTLDKDDVGFFDGNSVMKGNAVMGRTLCNQLSIMCGVPIANDVYGTRGYGGDAWAINNAHVSLMGLG